jgi:hypothetical protein
MPNHRPAFLFRQGFAEGGHSILLARNHASAPSAQSDAAAKKARADGIMEGPPSMVR